MTSPEGNLDAPFPYFGGKAKVAEIVWSRLGDVTNYVVSIHAPVWGATKKVSSKLL